MLSHKTIHSALQDRNLSELKRRTGVSLHTIIKMRKGKFDSLLTKSVVLISDYLESTGVKDAN